MDEIIDRLEPLSEKSLAHLAYEKAYLRYQQELENKLLHLYPQQKTTLLEPLQHVS